MLKHDNQNMGQAPMFQTTNELTRAPETQGYELVNRLIALGLLDGETPAEQSSR